MFMKKLLMIIPIFVFAFALTASADACRPCQKPCNPPCKIKCCPSVDVSSTNFSAVKGNIGMTTNSGGNNANWNAGLGKIDTGNANASAALQQQVGYNETRIIAPWMSRVRVNSTNFSAVSGNIGMSTNTGWNNANGNEGMLVDVKAGRCQPIKVTVKKDGRGVITTGNANASSEMLQLVGSNFTKIESPGGA